MTLASSQIMIRSLWDQGYDTAAISKRVKFSEAFVAAEVSAYVTEKADARRKAREAS